MFRLTVYCDDKQLAPLMHALAGKVKSLEGPVPVVNAVVQVNGKLAAKTGGNTLEMFQAHLHDHKSEFISKRELEEFLERIGRAPSTANHLYTKAIAAKLIKRVKNRKGIYEVIHG